MKTLLPRNAPSEANLDKEDIQIVMDQAQCKREEAIYAMRLTAKNGQVNIVDAILELTP
jgi:NACalpha-BTF3-like transcription factor